MQDRMSAKRALDKVMMDKLGPRRDNQIARDSALHQRVLAGLTGRGLDRHAHYRRWQIHLQSGPDHLHAGALAVRCTPRRNPMRNPRCLRRTAGSAQACSDIPNVYNYGVKCPPSATLA